MNEIIKSEISKSNYYEGQHKIKSVFGHSNKEVTDRKNEIKVEIAKQ